MKSDSHAKPDFVGSIRKWDSIGRWLLMLGLGGYIAIAWLA